MRVLAMTPEQINMLPPSERATYVQIVCPSPLHLNLMLTCDINFRDLH